MGAAMNDKDARLIRMQTHGSTWRKLNRCLHATPCYTAHPFGGLHVWLSHAISQTRAPAVRLILVRHAEPVDVKSASEHATCRNMLHAC